MLVKQPTVLTALNGTQECLNEDSIAAVRKRLEVGERTLMDVSFVGKKDIGKECPLNFSESALTVDGGWRVRK